MRHFGDIPPSIFLLRGNVMRSFSRTRHYVYIYYIQYNTSVGRYHEGGLSCTLFAHRWLVKGMMDFYTFANYDILYIVCKYNGWDTLPNKKEKNPPMEHLAMAVVINSPILYTSHPRQYLSLLFSAGCDRSQEIRSVVFIPTGYAQYLRCSTF